MNLLSQPGDSFNQLLKFQQYTRKEVKTISWKKKSFLLLKVHNMGQKKGEKTKSVFLLLQYVISQILLTLFKRKKKKRKVGCTGNTIQ